MIGNRARHNSRLERTDRALRARPAAQSQGRWADCKIDHRLSRLDVAKVEIVKDELRVRLNMLEKVAALRGNVRVPTAAVDSMRVVEDPIHAGGTARACNGRRSLRDTAPLTRRVVVSQTWSECCDRFERDNDAREPKGEQPG